MKKPSFQAMLGYGVWIVSFLIGFVLAWLIVKVGFNTTFARYGNTYFVLTGISIGSLILIWADYLAGTKILPD